MENSIHDQRSLNPYGNVTITPFFSAFSWKKNFRLVLSFTFIFCLVNISSIYSQVRNTDKNSNGKSIEPTRKQLNIADRIGKGHSYNKHVVEGKEFPKIKSQEDFIRLIASVIANPTKKKSLTNHREAFYNEQANILVIYDPKSKDLGTCFRPSRGINYFNNLK